MVTFTKQTSPAEEDAIERAGSDLRNMGFGGDIYVLRNQVDVALVMIALHALNQEGTIKDLMGTRIAVGEEQRYAIVGAKTPEVGRALREKVNQLRELIGPAFGVTPETKEAPKPAKHQPLRP